MPVLDLHLDLCGHEKVRDFPDRGRLVMHGSDIHVVTTAVVLGTVATVPVSKTLLANSHHGEHTIEGRSRRNEYGAACRSCSRSGTWCGSCEGDHRQDQPF